jgi:site-specific recombinase XerD
MSSNYLLCPIDFLSREERSQLIKYSKEQSSIDLKEGRQTWVTRYLLVDLALYSGLRVQEMCDLIISDISFNSGHDPYIMVRHGKRNKKRIVYIDSSLSAHLKEYIEYKERSLHQPIEPDSPLIAGRYGNHSLKNTLQKSFKEACKKAGLREKLSIHSCRHTYATFLLFDTQNIRYVQKQLGHVSLTTTAIYSDILPEENSKLANMIKRDL